MSLARPAPETIVSAPAPSRVAGVAVAAVGVATLLVFLPALRNGFVNWDDEQNFVLNPHYRGLGAANLAWMFTTFRMGPYQPLSWLTLGLDYTLWGMEPRGYHLMNVLLHAANAAVACTLLVRLLRTVAPPVPDARLAAAAALGTLAWAVHPLRVESVAWVTERRDVLSGLFLLLALLAYVRRPGAARPVVVALGALALLAKASAMVLPALLLVLDVYPLRRLAGAVGWTSAAARRVLVEKLPLAALSAAAGVVALVGQRSVGALATLGTTTPGTRLATFLCQSGLYAWKTVVPLRLQPVYEIPPDFGPLHPMALGGGATLVVLLAAAWIWRTRWPVIAAAVAVYLIGFAPTNGIVQAGAQVAADRYTYLPGLAWAPLVAAIVVWPPSARATVRTAGVALAVALLVPLTVRQTGYWHDSVSLWERAVALAPRSALVHQWLGRGYMDDGRTDEMVRMYDGWLREQPDNARGWSDYAVLLTNAGLYDRALPALDKALATGQHDPSVYYARGVIRDRNGDAAGALADYDESLRLDPDQGFAYANRALVRRKLGDAPGALDDFAHAITYEQVRDSPLAYVAYGNYGMALAATGRLDDGIAAVRTAVDAAPPEAKASMQRVLEQLESRRTAAPAS